MPAKKVSLPANVEAERSVLGAMLMSSEACSVALSQLSENSFSGVDPRNQLVFRAMVALSAHQNPIDAQTVNNELVNLHLDEAAGGPEYLLELINSTINANNIDHYIRMVKDQAVLRDYLLGLQQVEKDYVDGKVTDVGEFIARSQQSLTAIANRRSVGEFRRAGEVAIEVQRQIEQESKRTNKNLTGVDTGFRKLNSYTHGWQPGDLVVLAARPSVGKTALALNLAIHATQYQGKPVAIFSGEMSSSLIMKRMLSAVSHVPVEQLTTGSLGERELQKVASAVDDMQKMNLFIDDRPNPRLGDIVAKTTKLKNNFPDLCAVFIDYINIIRTEENFDSRSLEIALITSTLKEMARNLRLPVIALSQINRKADENENGEPSLSNLKDSGSIEQDADIVMLMYRKDYYDNQGKKKPFRQAGTDAQAGAASPFETRVQASVDAQKANGKGESISPTTISVAKNRNGQTGKIVLLFSRDIQRFDDVSLETERAAASLNGNGPSPDDDL